MSEWITEMNGFAFRNAVYCGLSDSLTRYGERDQLPRLLWAPGRDGGLDAHPSRSDLPDEEHEHAAEQWATHLELAEDTEPLPHTRSWTGTVGHMRVHVWTVLDWDAWDAHGYDWKER